MKKRMNGLLTTLTACAMVVIMMSAMPADNIMTKENATTIINTNLLGKGIKGFKGTTPVKIYIKQDKVVKIEALPNHETLCWQNTTEKAFRRQPRWMSMGSVELHIHRKH